MPLNVVRPTVVNEDVLCQEFQDDNSITSRDLCSQVIVHHTTIRRALKRINKTHKLNRCVPHELKQCINGERKHTYQKLLQVFCKQPLAEKVGGLRSESG